MEFYHYFYIHVGVRDVGKLLAEYTSNDTNWFDKSKKCTLAQVFAPPLEFHTESALDCQESNL